MDPADEVGGIQLAPGILVAPHPCSPEHRAAYDEPLTVDNYEAKAAALRRLALSMLHDKKMRFTHGLGMDILCILKWGDGCTYEESHEEES